MNRIVKLLPTLLLLILFCFFLSKSWQLREWLLEKKYDLAHPSEEIWKANKIDQIIGQYKTKSFSDLDEAYLKYTKSNLPKYAELLSGLQYYEIPRDALNQTIAGPFRLKHFMCKDDYYKSCVLNESPSLTCLFNPKIFHKTLELLDALEADGYDKYAFVIINGHRHPHYNEVVGGAKLSRHIKGEAVDIVVGDINGNGLTNKEDKDIVLNILEKKVIGNEGGIGLYPGTDNVHYDVRGHRARWNSY